MINNNKQKSKLPKQRFRDIKKGKITTSKAKTAPAYNKNAYAPTSLKIKAFLTDAFMLIMPIMYFVFYLLMDGREDFASHKLLGWIYILVPLIIVQTLFMLYTGQTPGYRAYHITLIDEHTKQKPFFLVILFRNLLAILSLFSIFGWILMFFRKDYKTLHDLLSATAVVIVHDQKHA